MQSWVGRQPLTLSVRDICSVLHTPTAHQSHWTDILCWMASHAERTASEASYIWSHGISWGPASSSGLGSLTKMSPLQVTDQMAWWEGGPWIRLLSQQDMFSKDSYKTRSKKKLQFTERSKTPIEMLSTVKQNFTSARSCKSAKWICSFFSKGTKIQWFRNYYITTGTDVVCRSWSGWSISQVCPWSSVSMPVCLYKTLSASDKREWFFYQYRRTQ